MLPYKPRSDDSVKSPSCSWHSSTSVNGVHYLFTLADFFFFSQKGSTIQVRAMEAQHCFLVWWVEVDNSGHTYKEQFGR